MNVKTVPFRLGLFVLAASIVLAGLTVRYYEPVKEPIGCVQTEARPVRDQESAPSARETLMEIRNLAQRYEKMGLALEKTSRENDELARSLREALAELHRTHDDIQNAAHDEGEAGERQEKAPADEDKLTKTIDNLNDVLKRLSQLLNDENQRNLAEAFKSIRAFSETMQSVTKNADEFYKNGRQAMIKANEMYEQAEKVFSNLVVVTKPLAERSESIVKNLDESSEKLNHILSGVDELLRAYTQADGTFQRLLTDPALYNNLNALACLTIQLMPRLERMVRDLEVFVDKIARHPELLGLSGVVRPSVGIKEAPVPTPVWPRPPGHQ